MVKWYFSKDRLLNRTPSRANGVDFPTECRYRREGCRFIMDMGNKLGLRYDTMATGVIYFHRFYMKQSFNTFPRWVTACACLFLAGKVEETPKKCRDIITVAKKMLTEHHFRLFGENPREEVMIYERVLLQTIKFDLQVEHPYGILLKIGKLLKGDKGKVQKLVQMAWTFVNDSLSTSLSLRKRPEVLAIAHLSLAGRLANFDLKSSTDSPSSKPWWYSFNKECQELVVEEICNEMLELYGAAKKEKPPKKSLSEKLEPSPNNSSHSSPSVTNSPPFKRKKLENKDKEGKSTSVASSTKSGSKIVAAPPPPPFTTVSVHPSQAISSNTILTSAVENISPVITSDSLSKTTSYSLQSSMPQSNIPPVPSPLVQPTVPYVNPVLSHGAFLGGTFSPIPFSIPPPTDSTIPASSSAATLLPPPNLVQNPSGFPQTFARVPPPLHRPPLSLQSHTQPTPLQAPPSYIQSQPPPSHIQPPPTHNIQSQPPLLPNHPPPTHIHSQPPPSQIPAHPPPPHMQTLPPPSHMQTQPPSDPHHQSTGQTYGQRPPPLPPHKLFPSMHHQHATQPPAMQMLPRGGMNNAVLPPASANQPNWHTPNYSRLPNTRPMGRGGWMR
ncbi:cyclin-K-like [Dendronephthya gigantea]|uniref:cyclin-K-like n=1 Tax=Dendronephthya gigantea TaxID=151771 RepID=UPI00106BA692|nr:cyclin-K-like [Dendronephthya gigantea]